MKLVWIISVLTGLMFGSTIVAIGAGAPQEMILAGIIFTLIAGTATGYVVADYQHTRR